MGKFFAKTFLFLAVGCGILAYAYFFPATMGLLDKTVNKVFTPKQSFTLFADISNFAKNAVNTALYYIDIIDNNIKGNLSEKEDVPTVLFTCLGKFPSNGKNITSPFGKREHPIYSKTDFHTGIDIAAPKGSDIMASWPGKIKETGTDKIYGNYIVIEHGTGFLTKYCHLSKITVNKNIFVNAGDKIGEAGSTGLSTGSHLHFEVLVDGINIDPESCIVI